MKRILKIVGILGIIICLIIPTTLYLRFEWLFQNESYSTHEKNNTKKALILIIENNDMISDFDKVDEKTFKEIASIILDLESSEIESLTISEIINLHLEDYLAEKIQLYTSHYDKVVYLTDEDASYSNFKTELIKLNKEGFEIDLLLDLHGDNNGIIFYEQRVTAETLVKDLSQENISLGFVYQTLCYGSTLVDDWKKVGVKQVNGAIGKNMYVTIAPIVFIKEMNKGNNFQGSVIKAKDYEINTFKVVSFFIPEVKFLISPKVKEDSRMIF